jgi:hypothetical protein
VAAPSARCPVDRDRATQHVQSPVLATLGDVLPTGRS